MIAERLRFIVWLALLALPPLTAQAQAPDSLPHPTKDLGDLVREVLPRRRPRPTPPDSARTARRKEKALVVLPAVAYTLEARLLATLTASYEFRRENANLSVLATTLTYTQNQQIILALNGPLWTSHNHSLWLMDYRLLHYPQATYGLGSSASILDAIAMNYNFVRVHQSYYHRVGGPGSRLYAGGGYFLDAHRNIVSLSPEGQQLYAISGYSTGVSGKSTSSGVVLSVLRDTRANQLRPAPGESYFFLSLRDNVRALNSDANYRFYQFDGRRYFPAGGTGNVLAFWLYGDFVNGQNAPYLDLPATGWDTYSVTGRGYIQGRFRGTDFLYGEAEYRFNLTPSRVLGGVLFANGQTTRNPATGYGRLAPGVGTGLRLCLNKKVGSYLAVDYAFGVQGSQGVFFNLGDVF